MSRTVSLPDIVMSFDAVTASSEAFIVIVPPVMLNELLEWSASSGAPIIYTPEEHLVYPAEETVPALSPAPVVSRFIVPPEIVSPPDAEEVELSVPSR